MLFLAPPASAAMCENIPATTLDVEMDPAEALTFEVDTAGVILVNDKETDIPPCDVGTTVLETGDITTIAITGTDGNDSVIISQAGAGGPWPDAVNFSYNGGTGTDSLTITGDNGSDTIVFGSTPSTWTPRAATT
jgi:hypothetical protein